MVRPVALVSGGVLLGVGVALDLLWVVPAYADVEAARNAPDATTRKDADALTSAFNTARWTTVGVLGGGVAITGVSFLLDAPGGPVSGPTFRISGRW
jgi:hypothetical protein